MLYMCQFLMISSGCSSSADMCLPTWDGTHSVGPVALVMNNRNDWLTIDIYVGLDSKWPSFYRQSEGFYTHTDWRCVSFAREGKGVECVILCASKGGFQAANKKKAWIGSGQ